MLLNAHLCSFNLISVEGDYFDLTLVPERFTGYSGPEARRIWRTIYEENCFGLSEFSLMDGKAPAAVTLPDTMTDVLREDGAENEQCLEKRVYYKVISGKQSFSLLQAELIVITCKVCMLQYLYISAQII